MSSFLAWILLTLAVLVVAGLALYAWRLWREVDRRKTFRQAEIARANRNCVESLDALSQAMIGRQIDLVEGALRCRVLLDIIDGDLIEREPWQVLAEVHQEAAHLKTHQSRRELTPRQRHREDLEREAIASRHEVRLHEAARELQSFCREQQGTPRFHEVK
ncbi:DUF2489 domain-containing protein [Salinicola avicenniae]|uniref:DUF2489 domain-containing protein n=1 Tax=Salinicola avicenniae TaxID=2916836 RepID=UPI0020743706|nr:MULTISPECIES: DUF2489 domain-containing protein [unclassified Salinicola]